MNDDINNPSFHGHQSLHCVQKKTPTHIFYHISMSDA